METEKSKIVFTDIHSQVWEHPADKVALRSLQAIPGLDDVIRKVLGSSSERSLRLIALSSAVRVGPRQFPHVYKLHQEACEILGVNQLPELYIAQNPFLNAGAIGADKPFITLNSSMLDTLSKEELIGVIGHEMGHIMSGHVLYKTLLAVLVNLSAYIAGIPFGNIALGAVIAGLREWDRKSELSSDRAGLLVTQDPEVSIQILMKIAGGSKIDQMNLGEFIKQAEEYNDSTDILDNLHKMLNMLGQSHPFPVIRVLELLNWVRTGEYEQVLRGDYSKGSKSFYQDVKDASKRYKEDFDHTVKPMDGIIKNVEAGVDVAARRAKKFMDDLKNKGK